MNLNLTFLKIFNFITFFILLSIPKIEAWPPDISLNSYSNQIEIIAQENVTPTASFHVPFGKTVRIFTRAGFKKCLDLVGVPSLDQNCKNGNKANNTRIKDSNLNVKMVLKLELELIRERL